MSGTDGPRYDYPPGTRIGLALVGPSSRSTPDGIVVTATRDAVTVDAITARGRRRMTLTRAGWEDGGSYPLGPA